MQIAMAGLIRESAARTCSRSKVEYCEYSSPVSPLLVSFIFDQVTGVGEGCVTACIHMEATQE